jgi:hypothetical protein
MTLDYQTLRLDESVLAPIKAEIFDKERPGYALLRGFLSPDVVEHMVAFWRRPADRRTHRPYIGKYSIYRGCPNYVEKSVNGTKSFYNFFWNAPADSLTYSVALQVQLLRNRIEGSDAFREIFPMTERSASFRVVVNKNGSNLVPAHRDFLAADSFDTTRTQVTLFLSEKGKDYSGNGFMFENNQGVKLSMGTDVEVRAGDLMVWRYNNEHAVDVVKATRDQLGFMRVIFPPERVYGRVPLAVTSLPVLGPAISMTYQGRYILPHRLKAWASGISR